MTRNKPKCPASTTLLFKEIVSISRNFGRLIPQCKRDLPLVLDEDLPKVDEVGFNGKHALESTEKDD